MKLTKLKMLLHASFKKLNPQIAWTAMKDDRMMGPAELNSQKILYVASNPKLPAVQ